MIITNKPDYFSQFLSTWELQLKEVGYILKYLHSYANELQQLEIRELLRPDELYENQKQWVKLCQQFNGEEKTFFNQHWVPILRDSFDFLIDLSSKEYQVFKFYYFAISGIGYSRLPIFDSSFLMKSIQEPLLINNEIKNKEEEMWRSFEKCTNQSTKTELPKTEVKIENPYHVKKTEFSEVFYSGSIHLEMTANTNEYIIKVNQVNPIICGLLPNKLKVNMKEFDCEFIGKNKPLVTHHGVETIEDLILVCRSKRITKICSYLGQLTNLEPNSEYNFSAKIEFRNNLFIVSCVDHDFISNFLETLIKISNPIDHLPF